MVDVKYLYQNIILVIFLIEVEKLRGYRMKKFFLREAASFLLTKISNGLVSASISSLFFVSIASSGTICPENVAVHYKYVTDTELSSQEKDLIVKDIPKIAEDSESTYYLVYRMDEKVQLGQLPNTGGQNSLT